MTVIPSTKRASHIAAYELMKEAATDIRTSCPEMSDQSKTPQKAKHFGQGLTLERR